MAKTSGSHRLDFEAPIIELEKKIEELRTFAESTEVDLSGQIEKLVTKCDEKKRAIFSSLTPWQKIQLARHPQRPLTSAALQAPPALSAAASEQLPVPPPLHPSSLQ